MLNFQKTNEYKLGYLIIAFNEYFFCISRIGSKYRFWIEVGFIFYAKEIHLGMCISFELGSVKRCFKGLKFVFVRVLPGRNRGFRASQLRFLPCKRYNKSKMSYKTKLCNTE